MKISYIRLAAALLLAMNGAATQGAVPDWAAGDWRGGLDLGPQQIEIVYRLNIDGDAVGGTMDVPDQRAMSLPLRSVSIDGNRLVIEMPLAGQARFEGVRSGEKIEGFLSQAGQSFPLTLERAEATRPPKRPQEPSGPVPYLVEEVFPEGPGMTRLAGTLTRPDSTGASRGIVLVAGAGPQDRDGTFMDHRPLLVLADRLTRAGFAVLRFDERGVGDSEGVFASATAEQLAGGIAAGTEFLRQQDKVDSDRVGILAHSEGGRISALAIQAHDAADFLVLLGAPARPGIEALRVQAEHSGSPVALLQAAMAEAMFQAGADQDVESSMRHAAENLLKGLTKEQRAVFGGREDMIVDRLVQALGQPQARFTLKYDPRQAVQQAGIPMLALYGGKDRQINAAGSAQAWHEALGDDIETELLAGLNHFFQQAETGAPSEYSKIEQTIAPEALTTIVDWLTAMSGGER